MSPSRIERIRDRIRFGRYDMSGHAMEEMAEDDLDIDDIEHAAKRGLLVRIERDDPRGIKYTLHGQAKDDITPVAVVGRFTSTDRFLIITVYVVTEFED